MLDGGVKQESRSSANTAVQSPSLKNQHTLQHSLHSLNMAIEIWQCRQSSHERRRGGFLPDSVNLGRSRVVTSKLLM